MLLIKTSALWGLRVHPEESSWWIKDLKRIRESKSICLNEEGEEEARVVGREAKEEREKGAKEAKGKAGNERIYSTN